MTQCTNLSAAIGRHTTPGALALIMLAGVIFGPSLVDTARGEPWVDNRIAIVQVSDGRTVVEDLTFARGGAHGLRVNTIEAEDGAVMCSTEHHNAWRGERNRFWTMEAFTSCPPPQVAFRVCSRFVVSSDRGRQRYFGPFCSALKDPG